MKCQIGFSWGETREEALDNIREAISLYLEAVNGRQCY
jgi:predicted RNase H-like HicB family nuclease